MSTRPARSAYDPNPAVARRPGAIARAQALPPAARRRGLLLVLALGLLASVAHPGRAHAQQMMRVGYAPANAAAAPAQAATTIQGPTAIQMQIQQQLQSQLDILNGTTDGGGSRASVDVGAVDPRVANQPCDQVELMLPPPTACAAVYKWACAAARRTRGRRGCRPRSRSAGPTTSPPASCRRAKHSTWATSRPAPATSPPCRPR